MASESEAPSPLRADLLHVLAHQLGQLEHRDGRFPAKDGLKRCIRIDLAFILGILQAVGFDVIPEFLGDLCARQRRLAHNGRQLGARPYGLPQPLRLSGT